MSDAAVIIGRWQFLQRSHAVLLREALRVAKRVIVVIGSAYRSRDAHNPFTWEERRQMIEALLSPVERERVSFLPVRDVYDDERWDRVVRDGVSTLAPQAASVSLVGFKGDLTRTYLERFPEWRLHAIEPVVQISTSDLRRLYFEADSIQAASQRLDEHLESGVCAFLAQWAQSPAYRQMATEHAAVEAYRRKYTQPFSLTSDCLVTVNGHVLLIKRGGTIGHGLWALPGGFVDPHERFYTAAVRELEEETGLAPSAATLRSALRGQAVFDQPYRSARGRIVTTAFHFELEGTTLPEVKGADDAKEARWIEIAALPSIEMQLFEDHAVILDHFVGMFPETK